MNEQPPDLPAEMQAVVANLESRVWVQGAEVDGDAVCAHGAVMTCKALRPGDEHIIRAVMRRRGLTEGWNDKDGRTKDEVLERMRQIKVSDVDLADTFGPSWQQVIAVIRRAAILTPDEAQRLADARGAAAWGAARAARDTAMDAAWSAAVESVARGDAAVRFAAWAAAWDAAWSAAWSSAAHDAARDAVRNAASAVVVADLVGRHGLTQDHIDTLMKPWVDALGDNWAEGMLP